MEAYQQMHFQVLNGDSLISIIMHSVLFHHFHSPSTSCYEHSHIENKTNSGLQGDNFYYYLSMYFYFSKYVRSTFKLMDLSTIIRKIHDPTDSSSNEESCDDDFDDFYYKNKPPSIPYSEIEKCIVIIAENISQNKDNAQISSLGNTEKVPLIQPIDENFIPMCTPIDKGTFGDNHENEKKNALFNLVQYLTEEDLKLNKSTG